MPTHLLLRYSLFVACLILWICGLGVAAEPGVDLEVVTEGSLPTEARAWSELLNRVGFSSVRIRSGGESPVIKSSATSAYRVIGVLTNANQLVLPYGKF